MNDVAGAMCCREVMQAGKTDTGTDCPSGRLAGEQSGRKPNKHCHCVSTNKRSSLSPFLCVQRTRCARAGLQRLLVRQAHGALEPCHSWVAELHILCLPRHPINIQHRAAAPLRGARDGWGCKVSSWAGAPGSGSSSTKDITNQRLAASHLCDRIPAVINFIHVA